MNNLIKKINKVGVPILILSLPLYLVRFKILGIPFTLLELSFFLVFFSWFIENYKGLIERIKSKAGLGLKTQGSRNGKYPFSFFIVLFVLSSFASLFVSNFSNASLGIYKAYFIEAVFFYILFFNYFKNKKNRNFVFLSIFVSSLIISIIAIYQKVNGIYWAGGVEEYRVTSVFSYPNALGLYLGPIAVFSYFYAISVFKKTKKEKFEEFSLVLSVLAFVLSILAIFFARSEAALGAVFISIFLGSIFISKRFAFSFVLLGIILTGIVLSNYNYRAFILEKVQLKDFSGEVRKQQWRETISVLKNPKYFIFGCGLSSYEKCVEPYHQEGIFFNAEQDSDFERKIVIFDDKYRAEHWRPTEIYLYPHNVVLNFWVELGLLGVMTFLGLLVQYFYFGVKLFKKSNNKIIIIALMFTMLEILIHGLVDVPYFKNDLSFLWWIFFGMIGVYWVEYKIESSK